MQRTLPQWLDYQLLTHPQQIAMGLERVAEVSRRLGLDRPGRQVVSVAGTNGKGSTVAFLDAIARAAGLRVGAFTSPHLLRYNERIRIDGREIDDASLVAAFEAIEVARAELPLTYFEFGTLAALWIFARSDLDLAILEVGLGGRLDAVNIVDADLAIITTVDLDHQEYLGRDRERIGQEKAGILRPGRPCVLAERDPPSSVLLAAYRLGAPAIRGHSDYLIDRREDDWSWREPGCELRLPWPALDAPAQLDNAAAAIAALRALPLAIDEAAIRQGLVSVRLPGRLQRLQESPELVLDVAHNPQSVAQLADWLQARPRPTRAVFSALADKDVAALAGRIDPLLLEWHVAGIDDAGARGLDTEALVLRMSAKVDPARIHGHEDIGAALRAALAASSGNERVLVFGSFHTVAAAWRAHAPEAGGV